MTTRHRDLYIRALVVGLTAAGFLVWMLAGVIAYAIGRAFWRFL